MVADQVMQIINEIALKLVVAAAIVYPMLVKQADVFCSTYRNGMWIFGISAIFAIALGIVCAVRYVVVHAYGDRVNEVCTVFAAILIIIVVSFLFDKIANYLIKKKFAWRYKDGN